MDMHPLEFSDADPVVSTAHTQRLHSLRIAQLAESTLEGPFQGIPQTMHWAASCLNFGPNHIFRNLSVSPDKLRFIAGWCDSFQARVWLHRAQALQDADADLTEAQRFGCEILSTKLLPTLI